MENKREVTLTIEHAKLTRSKHFGRYGIQFLLSINHDLDTTIMHTQWLGNYKDFNSDDPNKSTILWLKAKDFLTSIKTDKTYLDNMNSFVGITFIAIIGSNAISQEGYENCINLAINKIIKRIK